MSDLDKEKEVLHFKDSSQCVRTNTFYLGSEQKVYILETNVAPSYELLINNPPNSPINDNRNTSRCILNAMHYLFQSS